MFVQQHYKLNILPINSRAADGRKCNKCGCGPTGCCWGHDVRWVTWTRLAYRINFCSPPLLHPDFGFFPRAPWPITTWILLKTATFKSVHSLHTHAAGSGREKSDKININGRQSTSLLQPFGSPATVLSTLSCIVKRGNTSVSVMLSLGSARGGTLHQ